MGLKRTLDSDIAFTLPTLVVVSSLLPFAGLIANISPWMALACILSLAIASCAALLRGRGWRAATVIAVAGVTAGAATFALLILGISASKGVAGGEALANASATIALLVSALLLLAACVWSLLRVRGPRGWLVVAWVAATASPFIFAVPVMSLSSGAGNAGMDVIGFFFTPLAALLTWLFLQVAAMRMPAGTYA